MPAPKPNPDLPDLTALQALADGATPGPWIPRNMADVGFDSANKTGWWWVWQANVEHYAGVMLLDQLPDEEMGTGNIGAARIDDHDDGTIEERDARFIAAARTAVPQLIGEVRRLGKAIDDGVAAEMAAELTKTARSMGRQMRTDREEAERVELAQLRSLLTDLQAEAAQNISPNVREVLTTVVTRNGLSTTPEET